MTNKELEKIFTYHKPSEEAIKVMQNIRIKAKELLEYILAEAGTTRETDKCLELVEQLSMYANASISRHGLANNNPTKPFNGILKNKTGLTSQEFLKIRKQEANLTGGTMDDLQQVINDNRRLVDEQIEKLTEKLKKQEKVFEKIEKIIKVPVADCRVDMPRREGATYHLRHFPRISFVHYTLERREDDILYSYLFTERECQKIFKHIEQEDLIDLFI